MVVGPDISPERPKEVADDIQLHTLWGTQWQLGGREGYEILRAADKAGDISKPELIELFEFAGPSIILIDEWVAYARQLREADDNPGAGGSFGTQFTFAQSREAAAAVENVMVLITLPESEVEVGGARVNALWMNSEITSRDGKKWLDQQTDESFEIVRRRLFEPITAENADS